MVTTRLRADVERLAAPEGRAAATGGHLRAKAFLTERLGALGLEPYGERFDLPYHGRLSNLVGVVPGVARGATPVLVAAHHDTVPMTPGADDNAAAIAIALEVAARLKARPASRDVLIALFDAEEPPYFQTPLMGSTAFYHQQRKGPVHAAIVLDLVGHAVPVAGLEGLLAIMGMESDPALERVVTGAGAPAALKVVTLLNRYVGDMSDHHVFRLNEVPYLFLSCGRWEHYHAPTDTPDRLDYGKMGGVADLVESLVRRAADAVLEGPWEAYDTTPTDLALMRSALGPFAAALGVELRRRQDIERLVGLMMGRMGL